MSRDHSSDDEGDAGDRPFPEPVWDAGLAARLIGKRVLVGVPDVAPDGAVVGRTAVLGHAIRADRRAGIAIRLAGPRAGEEVVLPPDTRVLRPTLSGRHPLAAADAAAGEPDFVATWPAAGGASTAGR